MVIDSYLLVLNGSLNWLCSYNLRIEYLHILRVANSAPRRGGCPLIWRHLRREVSLHLLQGSFTHYIWCTTWRYEPSSSLSMECSNLRAGFVCRLPRCSPSLWHLSSVPNEWMKCPPIGKAVMQQTEVQPSAVLPDGCGLCSAPVFLASPDPAILLPLPAGCSVMAFSQTTHPWVQR